MIGNVQDQAGRFIARVDVEPTGAVYVGQVLRMSDERTTVDLFVAYDEAVQGQMLVSVDALEKEIERLRPVFVDDTGIRIPIADLQIYPSEMKVSFRRKRT